MAINPPPQSEFFYKGNWTKEKDEFFMNSIIKDFGRYATERKANTPIATLRRVRRAINERFEQHDSWDEICFRFDMLKRRYKSFNSLVKQPGVFWDQLTNVVHANDEIWHRLCEVKIS